MNCGFLVLHAAIPTSLNHSPVFSNSCTMAVLHGAVLWYYTTSYRQYEEELKVKTARHVSQTIMFCCAFAATFALSAHADKVTFPNADNSGDLASDAAWGDTARDATSDVTVSWKDQYSSGNRTYTAKEDISFASLELTSGTQELTGTFNMTESKSGSASRTITLSDSISNGVKKASATFLGGVWSVGGSFYQHSQNTFTVADGAKMTFGGPYLPMSQTTTLVVSDAGTVLTLPRINFPLAANGNAVVVTNGASMTLTEGAAYSSSSGTRISRGAIAMSDSTGGGSGRSISVSGSGSTMSITEYNTFAWVGTVSTSGGHSLVVSDGALYNSPGASLYVSAKGTGNNTVTVCDADSRMVVSNLVVGFSNGGSPLAECGDAFRILDGASVVAKANVTVQMGSTLAFGYPAGGFAANLVPLTAAGTLTVNSGCHVELTGIEERIAALETGTTEIATLATVGTGISIDADAIAAANASLPEKCELYVDGLSLKLKLAKSGSGLMIFVR